MSIEQVLTHGFDELASSTAIGESISIGSESLFHPSSDFCSSLELYFASLLRAKYNDWRSESLDGVFVRSARKVGERRFAFDGTAILISDQSVVPFKSVLGLEADSNTTLVISCSLSIGDVNQPRIECNTKEAQRLFSSLSTSLEKIHWKYEVGRCER
jgi:hypothetical protein